MPIRIGLVTDIHSGPDTPVRRGSVALGLVDGFVGEMRRRFRPHLVVDMGDRINDASADADATHIAEVVRHVSAVNAPALFLHGNHDVQNLDPPTVTRLLGRKAEYESVDHAGLHVVLLNTQDPTFAGGGGTLSDAQLAWLEEDLRRSAGPVVVVSHHPLDEQDSGAHWYFPTHPGCDLAVNRQGARGILARSGRVRAVFSGHMHWNHAEVIDGIPYVTVGSLVEVRLTSGQPSGGFAEVVLEDDGRLRVEVRGRLPMRYEHP